MLKNEPKFVFITDGDGVPSVELKTALKHSIYGRTITVPAGFVSDGMSIPWLFQPLIGSPFKIPFVFPAIVHDWFYRQQMIDRNLADTIFRAMLTEDGVSKWKCAAIYYSLRLFGWIAWNKNTKKKEMEKSKNVRNHT